MDKILLEADHRTVHGKKNAQLRAEGKVPAVAYGHGAKPQSIVLEGKVLEQVYRHAGGNKIVSLKIGDSAAKSVLFHEVQRDNLRGGLTHVDFYVVRMDELLKAEIPFHFTGESVAVYQQEGTLMKNLESIEVECLPGDLPESIEVNIAVLDDFEKTITLADLAVPKGVKFLIEDTDTLVAKVEPPRSDEEMAELDEAIGDAVPEGVADEAPAADESAKDKS